MTQASSQDGPSSTLVRAAQSALTFLSTIRQPERADADEWNDLSTSERVEAVSPGAPNFMLARAVIGQNKIWVRPERRGYPTSTCPTMSVRAASYPEARRIPIWCLSSHLPH